MVLLNFTGCCWMIFWCQKKVSGIKKTCTRFPCERLRATLEGRTKLSGAILNIRRMARRGRFMDEPNNSPLRAYGAIFESLQGEL